VAKFLFTERAENDLEDIIDYTLIEWGSVQSHHYVDGLEELSQLLADNPSVGTSRDSLSKGVMSFSYRSHILYYIKQRHGITIVRVLHKVMGSHKRL
jgi:toxin ParE1/3/4